MKLPFLLISSAVAAMSATSSDLVVYGSTPAGIAAAVNAARHGLRVTVLEPTNHFGGMVTGGMSNTDFKSFEAVQGTYREFMDRIVEHYRKAYGPESRQVKDAFRGAWYEPKVASAVLRQMLDEAGAGLLMESPIDSVEVHKGRIRSVSTRSGRLEAAFFIDATYEGDLLARAGCNHRIGRESRAEYGELFAGVKYYSEKQFLTGSTGEGDHRIQCYNFRICMTDDPANRVAIPKPAGYRREDYLELLKYLKQGLIRRVQNGIVKFTRIPNGKADVNDLMYAPVSLCMPGANYDWPAGDTGVRARIYERHKVWSLGLFWFLQNDPEVPQDIRLEASAWGLPKDEFVETGHFPPVLYVREGRRLKGSYVLTEADTQPTPGGVRAPLQHDSIAICDYSLDSHGNAPPTPYHPGVVEGAFNYSVVPYQLPYRVMVPAEVQNLLVPVAVSASHVAFSSLRMEPTWTALGQAAGIAAALGVRGSLAADQIPVREVQSLLHKSKALTIYVPDVPPDSPWFEAVQYFGNLGFFHDLPEYRNAPYPGRGKPLGKGQWLERYPQHDLRPLESMTQELAQQWVARAGLREGALSHVGLNRGDFLIKLRSLVVQHESARAEPKTRSRM